MYEMCTVLYEMLSVRYQLGVCINNEKRLKKKNVTILAIQQIWRIFVSWYRVIFITPQKRI